MKTSKSTGGWLKKNETPKLPNETPKNPKNPKHPNQLPKNRLLLCASFWFFGFTHSTSAATEFTATVMQMGGDYSTLAAADVISDGELTNIK